MSAPRYKQRWVQQHRRDLPELIEVLKEDPFEGWPSNRNPSGGAEDALWLATEVLYGDGDRDLASKLLQRSVAVADRSVEEDKLESPLCIIEFPANRSRLLRARSYAKALLENMLDLQTLRCAAVDAISWCAHLRETKWGPPTEETLLSSIRIGFLIEDLSLVHEAVALRSSFRFHSEQYEILVGLLDWSRAKLGQPREGWLRFDAYFDRIRNPMFADSMFSEVPLLRLELGALHVLLTSGDSHIANWDNVINAVSR